MNVSVVLDCFRCTQMVKKAVLAGLRLYIVLPNIIIHLINVSAAFKKLHVTSHTDVDLKPLSKLIQCRLDVSVYSVMSLLWFQAYKEVIFKQPVP